MRQLLPLPALLLFINFSAIGQRSCPFTEYRQQSIKADPGLLSRMAEVESFTRSRLQANRITTFGEDQQGKGTLQVITIPVVVHVVYNTSAENISDAQIFSQIAVLNRDYGKQNADTSGIPSYYSSLAADCGFHFA